VQTTNYYSYIDAKDSSSGGVGVKVSPPVVEDKKCRVKIWKASVNSPAVRWVGGSFCNSNSTFFS